MEQTAMHASANFGILFLCRFIMESEECYRDTSFKGKGLYYTPPSQLWSKLG